MAYGITNVCQHYKNTFPFDPTISVLRFLLYRSTCTHMYQIVAMFVKDKLQQQPKEPPVEAGYIKDGVSTPLRRVILQLENHAEAPSARIPKISDAPLEGGD